VDEHAAQLLSGDVRVVAQDDVDQVEELGHELRPGEAAPDHDEGEEPAALLRVVLGIGSLEEP
jgi:hypothetical protein